MPRRPDDFCVVFTSCLLPATFPGSFCSLLAHNAQRSPTARSRKAKATLNTHHNQFLNYVKQIVWQRVGETVLQALRLQRRCTCAFSGLAFTIFCQHLRAKTHTDAWNAHLRLTESRKNILWLMPRLADIILQVSYRKQVWWCTHPHCQESETVIPQQDSSLQPNIPGSPSMIWWKGLTEWPLA